MYKLKDTLTSIINELISELCRSELENEKLEKEVDEYKQKMSEYIRIINDLKGVNK
jgi:hypothetical protein